jgi:hypothetical protein
MDNTSQQEIAKTPKQQFIENVHKWITIENRLKLIQENTKKLRDMKSELGKSICEYMSANDLADKKIGTQNGEIKIVEKKEYTPLSYTYLELCLENILSDPKQVEQIMKYVKDQRDENIIQELRYYEK